MTDGLASAKQLITETMIDLVEDALLVDRPLRPSARRRVEEANEEVVRTLRLAALNDDAVLDPAKVQAICNAIARRHDLKPRHMFRLERLSDELAGELVILPEPVASSGSPWELSTIDEGVDEEVDEEVDEKSALGSAGVVGQRSRAPAARDTRPALAAGTSAGAHRTLAFAYLVLALMAIVLVVADLVRPDSAWPVTVALPALFVLLVAAARATLGASIDRKCEQLASSA